MLRQIKKISNVGLFREAASDPNEQLERVTLIYGENARGKSTLASILSASANGNSDRVLERQTIDCNQQPHIELICDDGMAGKFAGGSWRSTITNLRVFDSHFIEENVHSGSRIDPDHRKNLLQFALGSQAVTIQQKEREATEQKKEINDSLKLAKAELLQHSEGLPETEFISLPQHTDIDADIEEAITALNTALSRTAIGNQPLPSCHKLPPLDIDNIFHILNSSLDDVHDAAESEISSHLRKFGSEGMAEWVADGQKYLLEDSCPFCGQNTSAINLIESYRSHFNQAYQDLKTEVSTALKSVETAANVSTLEAFQNNTVRSKQAIEAWRATGLYLNDPGVAPIDLMRTQLQTFQELLTGYLQAKLQNVTEIPHTDVEEENLRAYWSEICHYITDENKIIQSAITDIEKFKVTLSSIDTGPLELKVKRLKLSRARHSKKVNDQIVKIETLQKDLSKVERDLTKARTDLKVNMNATLSEFSDDINRILKKQLASFRIERLSANFMGGTPRTDYAINLREHPVNLKPGKQTFNTALSESDKRMMAFAFFLASANADPNLKDKIIVVDDPMSSLDRNRRKGTVDELRQLSTKCKQLIVIAHDPRFLLDLDTAIAKIPSTSDSANASIERRHLKLVPHKSEPNRDPYSTFAPCDLSRECESKFAENYRLVSELVHNPESNPNAAAKSIRPLLEGYLHRRFPTLLPANKMFGAVLSDIENSREESPLSAAKDLVPELRRIGYLGNEVLHDTDPDAFPVPSNEHEIYNYATDALAIVHGAK